MTSMIVTHDEELSTGEIANAVTTLAGELIHAGYSERRDKPVTAIIDEITAVQVREPEPVE